MANQAVLACVEECCRKIMGNEAPFGGKVVVLLSNFRQTCPVIPRATKADILKACISQCHLWLQFQISRLITPIRNAEDPALASFVDAIGDGAGPNVNLSFLTCVTDIQDIVNFVYSQSIANNPAACLRCCILAPTNTQVDLYNTAVLTLISSPSRQYHATDLLEEHTEAAETATIGLETDPSP